MNRLETELGEKLQIIRLNVQDPVARILVVRYDIRFTPTFIFFDGNGFEQWRSLGAIDVDRVLGSVTTH